MQVCRADAPGIECHQVEACRTGCSRCHPTTCEGTCRIANMRRRPSGARVNQPSSPPRESPARSLSGVTYSVDANKSADALMASNHSFCLPVRTALGHSSAKEASRDRRLEVCRINCSSFTSICASLTKSTRINQRAMSGEAVSKWRLKVKNRMRSLLNSRHMGCAGSLPRSV